MEPNDLQNKIAECYAKLPADMQAMFSSMEWMNTLEALSAKYNMNASQIQSLGSETTLLLLGIIHPDQYEDFLKTDLSLPKDTQDKLMADINLGILNKWRGALSNTYEQNTIEESGKAYGGAENLGDKFTALPNETQEAILNSNYQKELYMLATEEKLSIDQMDKLEKATNKILLGIEHPENYEKLLESDLGLAPDKAMELASKINENILKKIRNNLKNETSQKEISTEMDIPLPPYKKEVPIMPIVTNTVLSTPAFVPPAVFAPSTKPIVEDKPITIENPVVTNPAIVPPSFVPPAVTPAPVIEPVKTEATSVPNTNTQAMPKIETTTNAMAPEAKIFGDSGIEMVQDAPIAMLDNYPTTERVVAKEETMMQKDGINVVETDTTAPTPPIVVSENTEKDTLYAIENPSSIQKPIEKIELLNPVINTPPATANSMLKQTLSEPVVNVQGASDQSMPKISSTDPYREKVE